MKKNITLKDIARALNISVSTVSRALSDNYQIGAATKQMVLDYAQKHNFVLNRMAKSLKEGKSRTVGVVICSLDNSYVAQMLDGIDRFCSSKGYQIIIMQSKELQQQENACIDLLHASGVEGLLISPAYQNTDLAHLIDLQQAGLPIVLFDRLSNQMQTTKVASNNFQGAYDATVHLINNGFRKIAHINTNTKLSLTTDRLEGYLQALKDHEIPYQEAYVRFYDFENNNLEDMVAQLMSLPAPPDALFTATDQITLKCQAILTKLGYAIPAQLAFIGFSNTEMADVFNPPLTTVMQPAFEIGQLAAQQLVEIIEHPEQNLKFETFLLATEIKARASTTKP